MRALRLSLVIVAAAAVTVGLGGMAYAFHSGGVAECEGCHSMHAPKAGGIALLIGTDASSTCLSCHEHAGDTAPSSYHVSTPTGDMGAGVAPKQRTPGGDFGWLKKTYTDGTYTEDGATHGHNIVAVDKGYAADPVNTTAPGGTFPAAKLACNSCHDQHGKYRRLNDGTIATAGAAIIASGSYATSTTPGYAEPPAIGTALGVYRLLAGAGYSNTVAGAIAYPGVPAAKAPSTYNQTEATNQVRVAYGVKTGGGSATWGQWCATCHASMHSTGNYVHPVDQALSSTIIANYNSYVKSGDLTGTSATAFSSLAPFATNSGDYAALAGLAGYASPTYAGPAAGDQVNCMSCHRAHASGMKEALRFDNGYEFMTYNGKYLGTDNTDMTSSRANLQRRGRTMAEWQAAYYDRLPTQFATYQRVLCNKCHAKD